MVNSLWQLASGKLSARDSLGGPVAIVRMAHQQAEKGWEDLLQLACNISLILGIMNLLPVPLLDGGTLVLCVIEGIRGRPLPLKAQAVAQNIGLTLIGTLFIFTFANDLLRLFGI
jgi:regulator of sigma E protease